jgi:gamma-glutamylcyclotransferase (GGCT)/AIG2-like uncharacterized protein YtfP
MRYFFYGTLRDPDVRRLVLGAASPQTGVAARLDGYVCIRLPGKPYPALAPGDGSVAGLLLDGISPHQRARLAVFEGTAYRETVLTVSGPGETLLSARAFIPRRLPRSGRQWCLRYWQRHHRPRLLRVLSAGF